jgi:hypothetical protein
VELRVGFDEAERNTFFPLIGIELLSLRPQPITALHREEALYTTTEVKLHALINGMWVTNRKGRKKRP